MRDLPVVLDAQQLAQHPLYQQAVNSECTTCRQLVVPDGTTGYYQVTHQYMNQRCGHAVACAELSGCHGCGLMYLRCRHCYPHQCAPCHQAELIAQLAPPTPP